VGEYTRGPWEVDSQDDQRIMCGLKDIAAAINVWSSNPETDMKEGECEANARLISAAPELLEALEICLGHMTGGMDGNWADCDPVEVARQAVAKAKGEV